MTDDPPNDEFPRQAFSLHRVPAGAGMPGSGLAISGTIRRQPGSLAIAYALRGDPAAVVLPAAAVAPARRDGLWRSTCFEAFLAPAGREPYWEVNLSPSGDWNVYRLDGYRRNLRPEPAVPELPHRTERRPGGFGLELTLPLPAEIAAIPAGQLEVGITAVLEHPGGAISYWALAHPGVEADFHQRESFLLTL